MIIPEDILKTQLCSECQRYLTVPPIKVYPNRHVKCGRCVRDNDNGVVSRPYETIMEQFEFPCVNRFEGCTKIMKFNDCVKKHEENCVANKTYECPLCNNNNFTGNAYYLQLHLTRHHSVDALHHSEVVIDLDAEEVGRKICWYLHKVGLVIIFCKYDGHEPGKLWLDVAVLGERQPPITQSFNLRSLKNNNIIDQTQDIPCTIWGRIPGDGFTIDIDQQQFPKRTVICEFDVKRNVQIKTVAHMPKMTNDASVDCQILTDHVEIVAPPMPKVMLDDASVQCNILKDRVEIVAPPMPIRVILNNASVQCNILTDPVKTVVADTPKVEPKNEAPPQCNVENSVANTPKVNPPTTRNGVQDEYIVSPSISSNRNYKFVPTISHLLVPGITGVKCNVKQYADSHKSSTFDKYDFCFSRFKYYARRYDNYLEICLDYTLNNEFTLDHEMSATFTLKSIDPSRYDDRIEHYTVCPPVVWRKNYSLVFTNFIEWDTLMRLKNIYIKDNAIRIRATYSFY